MMGTPDIVLSDSPAGCPWLLSAGDVVEGRYVGTVLLRSGDGYRREEPELESERFVALQVDFLYIPGLGDVRRDG